MKTLGSWNDLLARGETCVALTSLRGRVSRGLPPARPSPTSPSLSAPGRRVALVFGPERGGLTTEELQTVRRAAPNRHASDFPTLNLAQSVVATLALISSHSKNLRAEGAERRPPRTAGAHEETCAASSLHSKKLSLSAGYPGRGHSKEVLAEIESFVKRGKPTAREVTLLLGALAAVRRRIGP